MQLQSTAHRLAVLALVGLTFTACRPHPDDLGTPQPVALVTPGGDLVPVPGEIATSHPLVVAAYRGSNVEALRPYFTDNTVLITPEGRYTGWVQIQPVLGQMSGFELVPVSFRKEGDMIIEEGKITYKLVPATGMARTVNTTYIQHWHPGAGGQIGSMTIGNATTGN